MTPAFCGSEGYLYIDPSHPDMLLKLYHKESIYPVRENTLLEGSRWNSCLRYTSFPETGLYYDDTLVGCELPLYACNYPLKNIFFVQTEEERKRKKDLLIILNIKLKELVDNGIFQMDLHSENILMRPCFYEVNLIDLDSLYMVFTRNKEILRRFMRMYRDLLLGLYFFEFYCSNEIYWAENETGLPTDTYTFQELLAYCGFRNNMIDVLSNTADLDCDFFEEFLNYVEKEQLDVKDIKSRPEKIKTMHNFTK